MKNLTFVKVFKLAEGCSVLQKKKLIQIKTKEVHVTYQLTARKLEYFKFRLRCLYSLNTYAIRRDYSLLP